MPGKELEMHNGDVHDARVCHACQQPGDVEQYSDGEYYHPECAPDHLP